MAGAGYKLFNTGDVLTAAQVNTYLMEQTTMVFADAAARTAALTGVVAEGMISYLKSTKQVEVYNGSAWVASDDPNAIQNTIVDAKGDLISATGNDVPARLAVGNNGETLVADSSTSTGLRYNPAVAAGKNLIINGNMAIAQRGTSSALITTGGYRLDRWGAYEYQSCNAQQITSGSTTVPSYFAMRCGSTTAAQGVSRVAVGQQVESGIAQNYAGRTLTLSFWIRFSAATTPSGVGDFKATLGYITAADPAFGTTGLNSFTQTAILSGSLPTTWTKYTVTGTMPTNSRSLRVQFQFDNPFSTTNANDFYYDITGVQLELGSVATEFTLAGGTLAGELAACQRYYWRTSTSVNGSFAGWGNGFGLTSTTALITIPNPVPMRTFPSSVDSSLVRISDGTSGTGTGTVAINTDISNANYSVIVFTASSITQYRPYILQASSSTSGYIGFSAEL